MKGKLPVANWKLNPESIREAKEIISPLKKVLAKLSKVEVVVCPPAIFIESLVNASGKTGRLSVGGQDAFWEVAGAYTGQVSPLALRKAGAKYVILGHSERRALGETDGQINLKIKAALKAGLKVVLCVGEQTRDQHGFYLKTLKQQVEDGLKNVQRRWLGARMDQLIVAYEPVWAIGLKAHGADTPAGFHEQSLYIKKIIGGVLGNGAAYSVPVLYGGSVSPKNAASFLEEGQADGLLVGHESLDHNHFSAILKIANG